MTMERPGQEQHAPRGRWSRDGRSSPSIVPSSLAEQIKNQRFTVRGLFDHWYIAGKKHEVGDTRPLHGQAQAPERTRRSAKSKDIAEA